MHFYHFSYLILNFVKLFSLLLNFWINIQTPYFWLNKWATSFLYRTVVCSNISLKTAYTIVKKLLFFYLFACFYIMKYLGTQQWPYSAKNAQLLHSFQDDTRENFCSPSPLHLCVGVSQKLLKIHLLRVIWKWNYKFKFHIYIYSNSKILTQIFNF